jgi:hypothetical protein
MRVLGLIDLSSLPSAYNQAKNEAHALTIIKVQYTNFLSSCDLI